MTDRYVIRTVEFSTAREYDALQLTSPRLKLAVKHIVLTPVYYSICTLVQLALNVGGRF